MATSIYSSLRHRRARARAIARDGARCTVSRLLGGECTPGPLHAHHIIPVAEGGREHEDNYGTTCSAHHPMWEALRRVLVERLLPAPPPRCPHPHRSREAREICERRLARERGTVAA